MAKIDVPFVGVQIEDKTLLIILGALAASVWLIKRDLESKIVGAAKIVKDTAGKTIDVITSKPGEYLYDLNNPPDVNPETGYGGGDYWISNFTTDWIFNELHPQIRAAQNGEYTHRADSKH